MAKAGIEKARVSIESLIDPSIIDRLTEGFLGFIEAIQQLVENAVDAGATEIVIRFFTDREGKSCVSVIDNGSGMGENGRDAYVSICRSTSRGQETKKGRNGTGRLGFFHHAAECYTVEQAVGEDPHEITLTRDALFYSWFRDRKRIPWNKIRATKASLVKDHGTAVIWKDLSIGNRQSAMQRKPEILIEGLAQKLAPNVGPMVKVEIVDETNKAQSFPLKKREIKGNPIKGERHKIPGLGDIYWDLYIVAKHDRSIDHVMMGANSQTCTWLDIAKKLISNKRYESVAREIHSVLYHPQVVGTIFVPRLNVFAGGDRKSYTDAMLFDEEFCDAFVDFLRKELVPLVETELGMRSEELFTTDDETFVAGLCQEIQNATGVLPLKQTIAQIELNHHRMDMVPGQTCVFEVKNPKAGKHYVWDDSKCGGKLTTKIGQRVEYTAGKEGEGFKLIVRTMEDAEDGPTAIITINIFSHLPMKFTKPTVTMGIHDTRNLNLINVAKSAKLKWSEQTWGGKLKVNADQLGATAISAARTGVYEIRVVDENDPEQTPAICEIHIDKVREGGERPKTGETTDTEFVIDGHRFHLFSGQYTDKSSQTIISIAERGNKDHVITLNLGHPTFIHLGDSAKKAVALREISIRAAQLLLPESASQEVMLNRSAEISTLLAKKKD